METALLAIMATTILGVALGAIIGAAAKFFAVSVDPRIEFIEDALPGANCGGCGLAGCADFAKALVRGDVEAGECPVCNSTAMAEIARILGIDDAAEKVKKVALVLCGGDDSSTTRSNYNGISDCKAAALISSGAKGCTHGCLGLGSCSRACPFDAIEMKDGMAIVHNDLCVGCEKCVATCPKDLIVMKPINAKVDVLCNSPEKGPDKKKVCSVSCIGCRKCVKESAADQMSMEGFVARVNFENPPSPESAVRAACPTGCLKSEMDEAERAELEKTIAAEKEAKKKAAIAKAQAAKAAKKEAE